MALNGKSHKKFPFFWEPFPKLNNIAQKCKITFQIIVKKILI